MYIDLTVEEAKELIDLIRGGNRQQEEPKKEGKKGTKKKPLDLGKVKALRDAGWSNSKIADELKVSTSTIQRAVTEMKGE